MGTSSPYSPGLFTPTRAVKHALGLYAKPCSGRHEHDHAGHLHPALLQLAVTDTTDYRRRRTCCACAARHWCSVLRPRRTLAWWGDERLGEWPAPILLNRLVDVVHQADRLGECPEQRPTTEEMGRYGTGGRTRLVARAGDLLDDVGVAWGEPCLVCGICGERCSTLPPPF
jgi:hypothetical protein